jgi:rSAM/selenodomain-associated transferase 1
MVGGTPAPVVAVLTRAPSAGGKTRLFAALGRPPDPTLLSALLLDTIDGARATGRPCVVAVEPPAACDEVTRLVPDGVRVRAQVGGTLGDRMRDVMAALLAEGAPAVVLVGSDLPDLRGEIVEAALAHLAGDPASLVLGPAADGGYYLIAATRVPPVFDGIAWGGPDVLSHTLAAARRAGQVVHLLDELPDVDTLEDLAATRGARTRAWRAASAAKTLMGGGCVGVRGSQKKPAPNKDM